MSHFTSHVASEDVLRTVSVAQPLPLVLSATTPAGKSTTAAQLTTCDVFSDPTEDVQHSSLSAPVLSHVSVAHSEAVAEESAEVPAAHVIVLHAARATHVGNPVGASPAAASDAHVTVAVCAT